MAALTPEKFKVIGYTEEDANRIDRPTISYWQDAWRRLRKNPIAMGSLVVLGILLVMVIIGPHIKGYDYVSMNIAEKNQGVSSKYWFGTDNLGRDLFSRVWVGARASLIIAIVATAIKLIIGTVYGALMAHFGGWVDEVLMRIIEVINSIPSLLLTILIMMILGNNLFALLVALSVTAWCNTARQVRGMIKQLRETEYVYDSFDFYIQYGFLFFVLCEFFPCEDIVCLCAGEKNVAVAVVFADHGCGDFVTDLNSVF